MSHGHSHGGHAHSHGPSHAHAHDDEHTQHLSDDDEELYARRAHENGSLLGKETKLQINGTTATHVSGRDRCSDSTYRYKHVPYERRHDAYLTHATCTVYMMRVVSMRHVRAL